MLWTNIIWISGCRSGGPWNNQLWRWGFADGGFADASSSRGVQQILFSWTLVLLQILRIQNKKYLNGKIKESPEKPPKEMCATQKWKQQQKQEKHVCLLLDW